MIIKLGDIVNKRRFVVKPVKMHVIQKRDSTHYIDMEHKFPSELILIDNVVFTNEHISYLVYRLASNISKTIGVYLPNYTEFTTEGINPKPTLKAYELWLLDNLKTCLRHYFTVGSDPEVFVDDKNGKNLPAFSFLPAKDKPTINGRGNTSYWDGFQAEFTTASGMCLDGHVSSIFEGLKSVLDQARKADPGAKLSHKTVIDISQEQLTNAADEHIQFGCMPSLNIYGLKGSEMNGRHVPFRPAGGHIHLGVGKKTDEEVKQIVKALDAILGVACVSLFASFDDVKRRQLYGLPGEYRLPAHGLEYRTLSNAWIVHPIVTYLVFGLARHAVMFAEQGLLKYWKGSSAETIKVIMNCDVKQARTIMERNKEFYLKFFEGYYYQFTPQKAEAVFKIFINGMESILKNPNDVVANWKLDNKEVREHGYNYHNDRVYVNVDAIIAGKKVA